jgi:carbamoyl-phosphate synthase large subunit
MTRPRLRLLVTSAGRRVELLRCFREAGAALGVDVEILACDLKPELSSACMEADAAFRAPRADDDGYANAILELCRQHSVDLVVPTIDPELLPLSRATERFTEAGTHVSVSSPMLVEIARDKLKTAEFFAEHGVPAPHTWAAEAVNGKTVLPWPMLAKPRHGSSGRSVRVVHDSQELATHAVGEPFIVQQLLQGREFTVNMFFDRAGKLRCAVPHERLQIRAGEVEKGITRRLPSVLDAARRVADALPAPRGALCFQAMVGPDDSVSVFEINARFGGGYPLAHRAGATFARWLLEERLDIPSTASDGWAEGVLMLRYDAAHFSVP